jgi:thiol peroxidase
MATERLDVISLNGNPLTLIGPELKIGDLAPEFEVVGKDMGVVGLSDTEGKVRVFSVIPSIDTPVCDTMTRRFNEEAAGLSEVQIYSISMDLPFGQSRWCAAAEVENLVMFSDHRSASFGTNYGTLIKELRLQTRAIFVLDKSDKIRHVEYVREISGHPDYEAALEVIREVAAE